MKQNNIFKPTLKFSEKTSVSNVNVSNDNFCLSLSWHPVYVVKFDPTVAKTGTTQIIRRGHIQFKFGSHNFNFLTPPEYFPPSLPLPLNFLYPS